MGYFFKNPVGEKYALSNRSEYAEYYHMYQLSDKIIVEQPVWSKRREYTKLQIKYFWTPSRVSKKWFKVDLSTDNCVVDYPSPAKRFFFSIQK